jgi:tRNA dimethylallyltransferase
LAQQLGTEIISADSRQCYREMNIGVARPSPEELATVKHYFIASHSVTDDLNAGGFERYALATADELFQSKQVAVMVGGTGLYIKAFCEGIDPMPAIPEEIRKKVIAGYEAKGLIWLQKELQQKDPGFWQVAEQQNPQRLMRALEVLYGTGKSILAFRSQQKAVRPFRVIKIGLELPKEELHKNIHTRVDRMMKDGLLEEVRSLEPYRNYNALRTVGYRELFDHLDGFVNLEQAAENIKTNTRHYAKRQMTWFRKDSDIHWFSADAVTVEGVLKLVN